MYTYKLGGMLITDELYHDDLEAMTFGRKDQNELMHYGIKGQSWGKRRFQNEDGSLTMAGRNRYDVGAPLTGTTAANMAKNLTYKTWNGSSNGYGGASGGGTSTAQPGKKFSFVVPKPQTKSDTRTVPKSITDRANSGKKAADNIFGKIGNWAGGAANTVGNWAGNAAKDIGRTATNAYNDASKAVGNAARDVGNWAGNAAQDVGNFVKNAPQNISDWYTGDKAGREAQRYDNVVQNFERNGERNINEGINTISDSIDKDIDRIDIDLHGNKGDSSAYYAKNRDDLHDMSNKQFWEGLDQRDLGYRQHDIAREYGQKADEAQARYDAAPRQMLNAAGNWIGDRVSDAGNTVGSVLKPGINAVGNSVRDVGNWVGDRAQDVGNAVSDSYDSVKDTVTDAAQGVKDWYTGEGDKRSADWYRNLSTRDTDFLGTGRNLIENHQAVADESREIADNLRKNGDYENAKRYEQNAEAYQRAVDQMTSDRNRNLSNADMYDERYNNAPRQKLASAAENVGNAVSSAAKDVGDWVGQAANDAKNWVGDRAQDVGNAVSSAAKDVGNAVNGAAKDVANWGAGAVESGRNFFNNLFGDGNKESEQPTLSDPNERIITENIIPEQRITEQRIPEQRITEQRIPEAITREADKFSQMTPDQRQAYMDSHKKRPSVSGSNNVQTWDNGNINTWDNVKTFGDPDMVNTIKMLNDNGFFNRGSSSNSGNSSSMSDKPSNVSDEFWREYTFNGGTRDSYDREMNARKNSQNNRNGSSSRKEVVGTVDTSRPHHFTYDPASGQTIVVYDDEKRR